LGGLPVLPLVSSCYRVMSASFYCVHTEPRAPHVPLALLSEGPSTSFWVPLIGPLMLLPISASGLSFRLLSERPRPSQLQKKPSTASSCRKVSRIPPLYLSFRSRLGGPHRVNCHLYFSNPPAHRRSSFRMLSSVVLAIGLVHFTIRWSAPPFRRRNGGV
jgi:hypothetical protein